MVFHNLTDGFFGAPLLRAKPFDAVSWSFPVEPLDLPETVDNDFHFDRILAGYVVPRMDNFYGKHMTPVQAVDMALDYLRDNFPGGGLGAFNAAETGEDGGLIRVIETLNTMIFNYNPLSQISQEQAWLRAYNDLDVIPVLEVDEDASLVSPKSSRANLERVIEEYLKPLQNRKFDYYESAGTDEGAEQNYDRGIKKIKDADFATAGLSGIEGPVITAMLKAVEKVYTDYSEARFSKKPAKVRPWLYNALGDAHINVYAWGRRFIGETAIGEISLGKFLRKKAHNRAIYVEHKPYDKMLAERDAELDLIVDIARKSLEHRLRVAEAKPYFGKSVSLQYDLLESHSHLFSDKTFLNANRHTLNHNFFGINLKALKGRKIEDRNRGTPFEMPISPENWYLLAEKKLEIIIDQIFNPLVGETDYDQPDTLHPYGGIFRKKRRAFRKEEERKENARWTDILKARTTVPPNLNLNSREGAIFSRLYDEAFGIFEYCHNKRFDEMKPRKFLSRFVDWGTDVNFIGGIFEKIEELYYDKPYDELVEARDKALEKAYSRARVRLRREFIPRIGVVNGRELGFIESRRGTDELAYLDGNKRLVAINPEGLSIDAVQVLYRNNEFVGTANLKGPNIESLVFNLRYGTNSATIVTAMYKPGPFEGDDFELESVVIGKLRKKHTSRDSPNYFDFNVRTAFEYDGKKKWGGVNYGIRSPVKFIGRLLGVSKSVFKKVRTYSVQNSRLVKYRNDDGSVKEAGPLIESRFANIVFPAAVITYDAFKQAYDKGDFDGITRPPER